MAEFPTGLLFDEARAILQRVAAGNRLSVEPTALARGGEPGVSEHLLGGGMANEERRRGLVGRTHLDRHRDALVLDEVGAVGLRREAGHQASPRASFDAQG